MEPHKRCKDCGRAAHGVRCLECSRILRTKKHDARVMNMVWTVAGFQGKEQRSPTVRELSRVLGYKGTSTVQSMIDEAVALGYLLRIPNSARSLRVPLPTGKVAEG